MFQTHSTFHFFLFFLQLLPCSSLCAVYLKNTFQIIWWSYLVVLYCHISYQIVHKIWPDWFSTFLWLLLMRPVVGLGKKLCMVAENVVKILGMLSMFFRIFVGVEMKTKASFILWCCHNCSCTIEKLEFEIQPLKFSYQVRRQYNAEANSELLSLLWQCVGKKTVENVCIPRWQWLRHTLTFCLGLWFSFLAADTTYSTILYCLLKKWDLKGRNRRQYFSCWSPSFGFFVCPYHNRRIHYPTLEKPGAQNITACKPR